MKARIFHLVREVDEFDYEFKYGQTFKIDHISPSLQLHVQI